MNYHEYPVDVRWGEMDAQGHVNNVVYVSYFESARVEMMRGLGRSPRSGGISSVVVQSNISYRASAVYPAQLKVVSRITGFGRTSMTFRQTLQERAGDKVYCEGDITVVWVTIDDQRPTPVPQFIKDWANLAPE